MGGDHREPAACGRAGNARSPRAQVGAGRRAAMSLCRRALPAYPGRGQARGARIAWGQGRRGAEEAQLFRRR
eukprot:13161932-Alexandrium_andersonii.AAC.1